ncbi:MAG: hypothetical protein RI988_1554 [Pseudomonadota bacterium]|jgi:hypothetical protein
MTSRTQARARLAEALKALPDLRGVFSSVDPYAPSFAQDLDTALAAAARPYWPVVRRVFPDLPDDLALRHAWSVATRVPVQAAVLFHSVQVGGNPALTDLARHLLAASAADTSSDAVAQAILLPNDPTPPDLSAATILMPGIRLRYALAHRLEAGAKAHEFVRAALDVRGASLYLRRRELLRMLRAAASRGICIPPFEATEFLMRQADEHQLVLSSHLLIQALLPPAVAKRARLHTWVAERRAHRDAATRITSSLFEALEGRDFDKAEAQLLSIRIDPLARAALRKAAADLWRVLGESHKVSSGPSTSRRSATDAVQIWKPMSASGIALLKSAFPRRVFPAHWTMDSSAIASAILAGSLDPSTFREKDRLLLDATWAHAERSALVTAGAHRLFDSNSTVWEQLPIEGIWGLAGQRQDVSVLLKRRLRTGVASHELLQLLASSPDPKLAQQLESHLGGRKEKNGLASSLIAHAGTQAWRDAGGWNLHGREALLHLVWLVESGADPADSTAFAKEVAGYLQSLATGSVPSGSEAPKRATKGAAATPSLLESAAAACNRFPDVLPLLAQQAPAAWLRQLIPLLSRLSDLKYLQTRVPPELAGTVLQARALKTQDPDRLVALLLEGARAGWPIPWSASWRAFAGPFGNSEADAAGVATNLGPLTVLILALRRDIKRLKPMVAQVPDVLLRRALREAAICLRSTPGKDPVLLELGAVVGMDILPYLAAAMGAVDHAADPGHRVDHCYHQWQLPKNSGGTRTISAPGPALKRVQRALLDALLTPLGAHPCAYGFVKNRSIKDNASVHVGQPIVVNADVGNCFPSVRWPLVLGALRRDLGGELSAGAIGTIIDLCTAEGGLPIGAPTSPALLNRVLQRTDEILLEQAQQRGCRYSRYADDLTFSGEHGAVEMLGIAKSVLARIGLTLDPKKTNIFRRGRRQVCTGLVVNEQVSVPRRVRRRLRAAVHRQSVEGKSTWHGEPQSGASLKGRLAFLSMMHPQETAKLLHKLPSSSPSGDVSVEAGGIDAPRIKAGKR